MEKLDGDIHIKKIHIIIGCTIVVSFLGGWFTFYLIQDPKMYHIANSTGYQQGYNIGFSDGVKKIYSFNDQPENWIVADSKNGIALTNGTMVDFFWHDSDTNQTQVLNLKSQEDLGQTRISGTLYLMTSPVKLPQQVMQLLNMTQKQYIVLETDAGQHYMLDQNQ